MYRSNTARIFSAVLLTCCASIFLNRGVAAQAPAVLARGLRAPEKIFFTPGGKLLVAEGGNGPNTGRVSLIDRCGNQFALLDAMPSALSLPNNDADGLTAVTLRGRTLYALIGEGNSLLVGPLAGTNVENPNPASPLFSSVLTIEFSAEVERLRSGFTLPAADHARLKGGASVTLQNAQNETATLKLLADFPNSYPSPLPTFAGNVRTSHPFAVELQGNQLFIADAGVNAVLRVDLNTGEFGTLVGFQPLANPLPLGPPMIDAVPDGLRVFGDQLLVTLLSGFPFPAGKAEVRRVNGGSQESFILGLTAAIDVLPVRERRGAETFYVLEHSTEMRARPRTPGRLLRFDTPAGPPTVLADNLAGPVGLARDPRSGDLFISEVTAGRVVQFFGKEFDVFLRDDDNGDTLRFSSLTGEYLFTSCRVESVSLQGRGLITRNGCQLKLRNPFVTATLDACTFPPLGQGHATVRLGPLGSTFFIEGANLAR